LYPAHLAWIQYQQKLLQKSRGGTHRNDWQHIEHNLDQQADCNNRDLLTTLAGKIALDNSWNHIDGLRTV
jgi:hypothetical protein